jgi:hypothetical protein
MEVRPSKTKYNIELRRLKGGVVAFDLFLIDYTRHGRDVKAGQPEFVGTFPFREEAEAYAEAHKRGKRVFYFRGTTMTFDKKPLK